MDQWGYGAGGMGGYSYLPGQNIICSSDADYAGAVLGESYMQINDAYEVEELFTITMSFIKDDEYIEEPVYYYDDIEISEEEYLSYRIEGDYEWIGGELSSEEILTQLDEG